MLIIVVPDNELPVLAGTAEEERLRQLGKLTRSYQGENEFPPKQMKRRFKF